MHKLLFSIVAAALLAGCGLYATSPVNNTLDITRADFSRANEFRHGQSCSLLILGFIPWPWHANKTPDTVLGAIQKAGIQKVEFFEKTYDYHFFYAYACKNVYGY